MKPVIIIALVVILLIPFSAFGQDSLKCPKGTYYGLDNSGNEACRDSVTNQIVDPNTGIMTDSHTGQIILQDDQMTYIGIGVVIFIIIIAVIAGLAKMGSKSDSYKDVERADFSDSTKRETMKQQGGVCNMCKEIPRHWEFDHIDSRGDNSIENCQGLCKDCHQDKTLKDNERHRDSQES